MFRAVVAVLAFALAPACTPATLQALDTLAAVSADHDDCHRKPDAVDGVLAIATLGIAAVEIIDAATPEEVPTPAAYDPNVSLAGPGNAVGRGIAAASRGVPVAP